MLRIFKYFGSILFVVIIITALGVYVRNNDISKCREAIAKGNNQEDQTSEQYKMYFSFNGDKSQIIDLIEGKASFSLVYFGDSKFTARILKPDGTPVATLADVNGSYRGINVVDVPETGPYIFYVKTIGVWELARM
jgi:hypothetical protein